MAEKLRVVKKSSKMKRLFSIFFVTLSLCACNGNEEADKRQYNSESQTTTAPGNATNTSADDSTATNNNNAYNTDSASGQGNRYDSSNNKTR